MDNENISSLNRRVKEHSVPQKDINRLLSLVNTYPISANNPGQSKIILERRNDKLILSRTTESKKEELSGCLHLEAAERVRRMLLTYCEKDPDATASYFGALDLSDYDFITKNLRGKWGMGFMRTGKGWTLMLNPAFLEKRVSFEELGFQPEQYDVINGGLAMTSGLIVVCGATGTIKNTVLNALVEKLELENNTVFEVGRAVGIGTPNRTQVVQRDSDTAGTVWANVLQFEPDVIYYPELRNSQETLKICEAAMNDTLVVTGLHGTNPAYALERLLALAPSSDILAGSLKLIISVTQIEALIAAAGNQKTKEKRLVAEAVYFSEKSQSNLRRTGNHAKLISLIREKEGYLTATEVLGRMEKDGLQFSESDINFVKHFFGEGSLE